MRIAIIMIVALIISCTSTSDQHEPSEKKAPAEKVEESFKTGWVDPDTYAVTASGENEKEAVNNGIHKILKDIVSVRVRNGSRYTDISKIQVEFDKPLREGKVIDKKETDDGVVINFQIRGKDLKKKFER